MDNETIVQKIKDAREDDSFGVITQNALHDQLNTFTADDWKQASLIYSKGNAGADGFYITDDNGHVSIHNDMHAAHEAADNSVLQSTWNDAKWIAGAAVGVNAVSAIAAGEVGWEDACAIGGAGMLSAEAIGAGAAAAASAALWGGAIFGTIGAAVAAGDVVRNYFRKGRAEDEIKSSSEISFDKR